ncbi:MAG: N-acetyl-gamma-glutamyl-phosphate reductase [Gammaproteobacteria bacterium]|nr:N-acetyl-gamma-glutamyl-phosphate reductase [Gammaproteobacteria bacterium]MYC52352.1 N-acetyl-gamma-glutamyl-phosphate reductase [Gammaproteobacteria bacterium]
MPESIPAIVLGASGYVGGELLRLLASHPRMQPAAVVSRSRRHEPVDAVFPNLRGVWPDLRFTDIDDLPDTLGDRCAIFSTAAHGASAQLVDRTLGACEERQCVPSVVDVSADFRFRDAEAYEAVYAIEHGAPDRMSMFRSLLPEHATIRKPRHVGHPGCFATGMLLAAMPLMRPQARGRPAGRSRSALVDPRLMVSAVTGSTGAGRAPRPTTHHPTRHANMFAYKPLAHRHVPEVEGILRASSGRSAQLHFVPTSGPFARGIYMVLHARLLDGVDASHVRDAYADHYAKAPFVHLVDAPPRLKDVVGSNHARLAMAVNRGTLAVTVALDNLVKGAAGGAIQWMNVLHGLPETTGLTTPAASWM